MKKKKVLKMIRRYAEEQCKQNDKPWVEYEDIHVKTIIDVVPVKMSEMYKDEPERLTDEQVKEQKKLQGTDDPIFNMARPVKRYTTVLKKGCGKYIYRNLKKRFEKGELPI